MDSTTPATPPARAAWFMSENQSGQLQGYLYNLSKKKGKTRHPEFDATIPFACGLLCWSTCLTVGMLSLWQQKQYKKIACQLARKAPHALGLKHYCSMLGSTVNLNQEIVPNYQRVKRIL